MKIGDVVICNPPDECDECPYTGKTVTIISSILKRDGSTQFRVQLEDGTTFTSPERCLETLSSFKEREIKEVGDGLLKTIEEYIAVCVMLGDSERLRNLALLFNMHTSYSVLKALREKGLYKEIAELCDKAGISH